MEGRNAGNEVKNERRHEGRKKRQGEDNNKPHKEM